MAVRHALARIARGTAGGRPATRGTARHPGSAACGTIRHARANAMRRHVACDAPASGGRPHMHANSTFLLLILDDHAAPARRARTAAGGGTAGAECRGVFDESVQRLPRVIVRGDTTTSRAARPSPVPDTGTEFGARAVRRGAAHAAGARRRTDRAARSDRFDGRALAAARPRSHDHALRRAGQPAARRLDAALLRRRAPATVDQRAGHAGQRLHRVHRGAGGRHQLLHALLRLDGALGLPVHTGAHLVGGGDPGRPRGALRSQHRGRHRESGHVAHPDRNRPCARG